MLVFVATALGGAVQTQIGWPCQRLNWAWRNVWSTCSINSYAFHATVPDVASNTGLRFTPQIQPSTAVTPNGFYSPGITGGTPVGNPANPQLLCTAAPATGSGLTANLRNRCRRAIDAYGNLVKSCGTPPALGLPAGFRPANSVPNLPPDVNPTVGHAPHVQNVQGLALTASLCLLPAPNVAHVPADLASPSTTCPGLLGWFTVVFNACGFTNAPGLNTAPGNVPLIPASFPQYVPIVPTSPGATSGAGANLATGALAAGVMGPAIWAGPVGTAAPLTTPGRVGFFCGNTPSVNPASQGPVIWNDAPASAAAVSTVFRTSRCRKALDQFGRTATRCHLSTAASPAGPAQAGGYSDPLRFLAVGNTNSPQGVPSGLNYWAPLCN